MATVISEQYDRPVSVDLLALREALAAGSGKPLSTLEFGPLSIAVQEIAGGVCLIVRQDGAGGGLALRAVHSPLPMTFTEAKPAPGEARRFCIDNAAGEYRIMLTGPANGMGQFRLRVCFTPSSPTLLPYVPRDVAPLGRDDDPLLAEGSVEARQQGLNVALAFFQLAEPDFGTVLYLQDLTGLNDYLRATGTKPDSVVGGEWPDLGLQLPTGPMQGEELKPLEAGTEYILSDAILVIRRDAPEPEDGRARQFLQMLGCAYEMMERPSPHFRDWIGRAERTLEDLSTSPKATIRHYGNTYVHPYTAAEYPDSMVQLSVVAALHQWGRWCGEEVPFRHELEKGLRRFYDPELKMLRRWLPNVGDDKEAHALDSWYLYHPLLNLGILALDGDPMARELFLDTVGYGIKAAHHFAYRWPIEFDVRDFSIITECAPVDGRGQTDVGGIYAWVMLQAFELTGDTMYLDEARAAIDAAKGLGFAINYQANLTAWGAAACMRLWRITNDEGYREQSYAYIASFFHHCIFWNSRIGHACHYDTFLGASCLQDAPYMAMYECFDTFVAFERYLADSGPDLDPAARMLVAEYCKYTLSRAWSYYPDALPAEAVADEQRESNGHVDRSLSFPVEDLYPDGQEAGQVGQEVYGAGAAFIFASRAFHHVEGAPFRLFCNHFVRACDRVGDKAVALMLEGGDSCTADLALIRLKRRKLPTCRLVTAGGDVIRPREHDPDIIHFGVPARGRLILSWETS